MLHTIPYLEFFTNFYICNFNEKIFTKIKDYIIKTQQNLSNHNKLIIRSGLIVFRIFFFFFEISNIF